MTKKSNGARAYLVMVIVLLFLLPVGCVLVEAIMHGQPFSLVASAGKWLVFWGVGVRLFLAGVRQVGQPAYTATKIFEIEDPRANAIVRELGFANLSMGAIGLASLANPAWLIPSAVVGAIYYGLAGAGHVGRPEKNGIEQTALVSDLLIFAALAGLVAVHFFAL
jgi:hypothetical protein